jgi:hypothetical protein
MGYINLYRITFFLILFVICSPIASNAQGDCEARTIDQFFECYGGKSTFSEHSIQAISTFIQAEDAINAGKYADAQLLLQQLYNKYPVGNPVWWQVWNAPKGANIGTPHAYYGLRMMEDIIAYGLNPNPNAKAKKVNMNIVMVGYSQGIQPTTRQELEQGKGVFVKHSLSPLLKENNYRIIRQSLELFTKYVKAITNGMLDVQIGFIELDTLTLPVKVSTQKPYVASGDYGFILNALTQKAKDSTDWFLLTYPSHVPEMPVFDDESFITGGMGADNKGGPVFIADDKWVTRKPAHLGKGVYTDIERRIYLPQWLQHEFFHHLYRIYPELKLEVNGHDWFDRNFWPKDFAGQFENDYYSETLHKRLQLQCIPLAAKLITRIDPIDQEQFSMLSMNEFLGAYSLDNIQNSWHEAMIIKENDKYFWKNKANVQWQVFPAFTEGKLKTGADCPYPGQDFFMELYKSPESVVYPGIISLKFGGEFYKKRFGLLRNSMPIESALGRYVRVPATTPDHSGNLIKKAGEFIWKTDAGSQYTLRPDIQNEVLIHNNMSPGAGEQHKLILVQADCGLYNLGFQYMNYYYWLPKRLPGDESPLSIKPIMDQELVKGFGTFTLDLREFFADSKGDSLFFFATSADTALIKSSIAGHTLILSGGEEGRTTIYVMALDQNGGMVADEFEIKVKATVSGGLEQQDKSGSVSFWPQLTQDYIYLSNTAHSYQVIITSAITGHQEYMQIENAPAKIDLSHLSAGVYFLLYSDKENGGNYLGKVIKY